MGDAAHLDHPQAKAWNGTSGRAWVEAQAVLDAMFEPFEELLVDAVRGSSARKRVTRPSYTCLGGWLSVRKTF